MGINEFGKKRIQKNIGRLMVALFKASDIDLCLVYVLSKREISKRCIEESLVEEIDNLITNGGK